ncbi:hypothetical protein [Neobacillus mesonae]|uniref:hypothetical protein n=1 Tax=Neobacillus mesonae TaxID=1193713 RepID=UPI00203ED0FC|nr:hypothetical protein [Neobacillus mesonae]MCM3568396.1 hypothetical protein [Neobacillus mesonae]
MRKCLKNKNGYALMIVLVLILVMGLLIPVILTAATYGMKNTISTNNNITAQYIADTAYQETLDKVNMAKNSGVLSNETDISHFIKNNIIHLNGSINGGSYMTNYHPEYSNSTDQPRVVENYNGDPKKTEYTYYLRSTGKAENESAVIDYKLSFVVRKLGGTTILYDISHYNETYGNLPTQPYDLKAIAKGESFLNNKVSDDISKKLILYKDTLTPIPPSFNGELKGTINSARVTNVYLDGKTLEVNGDLYVEQNVVLEDDAQLIVKGNLYIGGDFQVNANNKQSAATLDVTGDFIVSKGIDNYNNIEDKTVYLNDISITIDGSVFVPGLKIEKVASDISIGGSLFIKDGNLEIGNLYGNKGLLKVSNDIIANNIFLSHPNLNVISGGEVLVQNNFEVRNNAYIEFAGGLEVGKELKLSNNVDFKFAEKLYITEKLENNGTMSLLKNSSIGNGPSYIVNIEDPVKLTD